MQCSYILGSYPVCVCVCVCVWVGVCACVYVRLLVFDRMTVLHSDIVYPGSIRRMTRGAVSSFEACCYSSPIHHTAVKTTSMLLPCSIFGGRNNSHLSHYKALSNHWHYSPIKRSRSQFQSCVPIDFSVKSSHARIKLTLKSKFSLPAVVLVTVSSPGD